MKRIYLCLTALLLPTVIQARDNGLYVGGSAGYSNLNQSQAEAQSILTDSGLTGTATVDDTDIGWKFFGGYDLNRYFGAEVSYVNLGTADYNFNITAPVAVTGSGGADVDGVTVDGTLKYPVNEKVDIFGKVGAFFWNIDVSASATGLGGFSVGDDGTDIVLGLGGKYHFNDQIMLRAEWERFFDVSDSDLDLFSVGVQYNFDWP